MGQKIRAQKLPCAITIPCSEVVRAAFEETSVAAAAGRIYWVTRSQEGAGGTEWDSLVERNGLGKCRSLGCTPRSLSGDRGPKPPAHFGNFSAVKSSPPEAGEKPPTRTRRSGCRGPPHRQHLSVALRAPPLLKERLWTRRYKRFLQPPYPSRKAADAARADVGIGPYDGDGWLAGLIAASIQGHKQTGLPHFAAVPFPIQS